MNKNQEIEVLSQELNFKLTNQKLERLNEIQDIKGFLRFIAGELVLINQKLANL